MALEGMITSGAKSLLQIAASRGLEEFKLLWGFKDDLRKFENDFEEVLTAVDESSGSMPDPVKRWMKNVNDLAYDAQDLMDELAYENYRLELELKHQFKKKIRNFFTCSNPVIFRLRMAHRVANLRASIADVHTRGKHVKTLIDLTKPKAARDDNSYNLLQQCRDLADASVMVGRDSDKSELIETLRDCDIGEDSLYMAAIVGLSGLGKTTLARKVFDDAVIESAFQNKIWVTVSREFNMKNILTEMSKVICGGKTDATPKELKAKLGGQKYLLVLDDVWNKDTSTWDSLKDSLQKIGEGIVLVTTRDIEVSKKMPASFTQSLNELGDDDSWLLFTKIAFAGRSEDEKRKFEKVGREIVEKCRGMPLAIKTIAGSLRSENDIRKWKKIERSELWNLPQGEAGILPSLKLSLIHLRDSSLKQCFAFFAFYIKGVIMYKADIIQAWSALGYLGQKAGGSDLMEDTGEKYFNALLNISFLVAQEKDDLGNITTFRVHDLVHDLALSLSNECKMWGDDATLEQDAPTVRHLKVIKDVESMSEFPETLNLKKVRSLGSACKLPIDMLLNTRYLRLLDLYDSGLEELPESIGRLKCLKYLDISGCEIKALPEFITRLYNLQTLRLENCNNLSQLPMGLHKMINLRHLLTSNHVKVPTGIEKLVFPQTAPLLDLSPTDAMKSFEIHELGCLRFLSGLLSIKGLEYVKDSKEVKAGQIVKKDRIDVLELIWSGNREEDSSNNAMDVLDSMQPHENLKSLKVQGYDGEEFPSWCLQMVSFDAHLDEQVRLDNLVILELIECKRCTELPELGQLGSLRILRLQGMESVTTISSGRFYGCESCDNEVNGDKNDGNDGGKDTREYFAALKEFIITDLRSLEKWLPPADGSEAFASLELLEITDCPNLKVVPEANFSSLTELIVKNVADDEALLRLIKNCDLSSLSTLTITDVEELKHVPEELLQCTSLKELRIKRCEKLSKLPVEDGEVDGLNNLESLEVFKIVGCSDELTNLPDISRLANLRELKIESCGGMTRPPSGLESCTSLKLLDLNWCQSMEIPESLLIQLHFVEELSIIGVQVCMEGLQELKRLRVLHVGDFGEEYDYFPGINYLSSIQSLTELHLYGWEKLVSFPEELQQLTAVQWLLFVDFNNIETVPEWFGNMSSVEDLTFERCNDLKTLPEALQSLKLSYLRITDCELLKERCAKDIGEEWTKISHISWIEIDGESIQDLS